MASEKCQSKEILAWLCKHIISLLSALILMSSSSLSLSCFIIVYNLRVCQWNRNAWSFLSRILHSRHQEIEERLIEEETARRVEELVARRVEEELEKRRDEIEHEVLRRVEEAKRIMEAQLLQELEKQRQTELNAQKVREVTLGRSERSGAEPQTAHPQPWHNLALVSPRDRAGDAG